MLILNSFHKSILDFLSNPGEEFISLRDIGREVGLDHPQKVRDKLEQLESAGYIGKNAFGYYQIMRSYKEDLQKIFLPFFGFSQCGNAGKKVLNEYPRKKLLIDERFINQNEIDRYFFTRAKGDSMEPFIRGGDFLLIKTQSGFNHEDRVLVVHNNKPKVKKIYQKGNGLFLVSLNKEHQDLSVEPYDETFIIGIVSKVFSKDTYTI